MFKKKKGLSLMTGKNLMNSMLDTNFIKKYKDMPFKKFTSIKVSEETTLNALTIMRAWRKAGILNNDTLNKQLDMDNKTK